MSALDDVIAKVQSDVAALVTAVNASVANLSALAAQVATLTQELATAGTAPTQAQIDALAAVSTSIEAETAALQAAAPPAAPAP